MLLSLTRGWLVSIILSSCTGSRRLETGLLKVYYFEFK
jgi:hypothetical protein